jgi:DNA-binding transcriptional LysR family regulator
VTELLSLDDLPLLAAFAEHRTLRGVALALGVPRSTISRRLGELEGRLGQELFLRRGRALITTSFSSTLLERAGAAQRALEQVQRCATDAAGAQGRLTIAASPLFAEEVLPNVVAALLASRPTASVELKLSHSYSNLFDGELDLALRRGPIADSSSLNARRLGRTTMVCVAARGLVLPTAEDPAARAQAMPWLRVGSRAEPFTLELARGSRRRTTVTLAPRLAADSQRLMLALVRRGAGVARVNAFLVREALVSGELVEVLPEARSTEDVFAVYPRRRATRAIVREFLNLLVATCRELQLWD